jgi:hypothetical protein
LYLSRSTPEGLQPDVAPTLPISLSAVDALRVLFREEKSSQELHPHSRQSKTLHHSENAATSLPRFQNLCQYDVRTPDPEMP